MNDLIRERRGCMENAPSLQYLVLICFVWAPRISTPHSPHPSGKQPPGWDWERSCSSILEPDPSSQPCLSVQCDIYWKRDRLQYRELTVSREYRPQWQPCKFYILIVGWIQNKTFVTKVVSLNENLLVGPVRLPETGLVWAEQTPAVCSAFTRPPTPCLPSHTHTDRFLRLLSSRKPYIHNSTYNLCLVLLCWQQQSHCGMLCAGKFFCPRLYNDFDFL